MAVISPLKLSVKTVSGKNLGQVVDVDIETATQSVIAYYVKPNRLVPDVVSSPLIIRSSQVVEITSTELIVDDAMVGDGQIAPLPTA